MVVQESRRKVESVAAVGVVGAALAPVLAAIGAIAALVNHCTIEIERHEDLPQEAGT